MSFQASCPTCGAPIEFRFHNSVVTVCSSCDGVVGRGDGKLAEFGKVADLVRTDSPLQVGLTGKYKGVPFEVTGRTQLRHAAGGVWDEWYVAFKGGDQWGWLAEAQGRYYLTFRKRLPHHHSVPRVEDLAVEDLVMIPGSGRMKVVEIGEAVVIGAEGEIPYEVHPGEVVVYADLEGAGNRFATLDGTADPPDLYLGGEFPLSRLGITLEAPSREESEREVAAVAVNCPNCGGSLDLRAPDQSERVTCPFCDSLLAVESGNLQFLKTLRQPKIRPAIPLGTEGTLRGRKYTVIGLLVRKVRVEGQDYFWQEYLLYTPRHPFHWLIHVNGHWTLGTPVSAGAVEAGYRTANYEGKVFRIFDKGTPVVVAVYGEFYWKVSVGETVHATDYIRPPYLLSREAVLGRQPKSGGKGTRRRDASEVHYTLGEYLGVAEIENGFGLKKLPRPHSVAPNQPYPHKNIYRLALFVFAAALLVGALVYLASPRRRVLDQTFVLQPTSSTSSGGGSQTVFSAPFRLASRRNCRIRCSSATRGQWSYVDGAFYNEQTGRVKSFTVPIAIDRAGPGHSVSRYVPPLSPGQYTLQMQMQWQNSSTRSETLRVEVHQGVPRLLYFLLLLLGLAVVPLGVAANHALFVARRWEDSPFNPMVG